MFTWMEVIFYWVQLVRVFPWKALTSLRVWREKWCHLVSEVEATLRELPETRAEQSLESSDVVIRRVPIVLLAGYDHSR